MGQRRRFEQTHGEFLPDGLQFLCCLCQISVGLRQTHPLHLHLTEHLETTQTHAYTAPKNTVTFKKTCHKPLFSDIQSESRVVLTKIYPGRHMSRGNRKYSFK